MPSFDICSEIDLQEVSNVVDQANRELAGRFDFRGLDASFALQDGLVTMEGPEEFHLKQMLDILHSKCAKRDLDVSYLHVGDIVGAGKRKRQQLNVVQGIDKDTARKIVKIVKAAKFKVQVAIQGDQVRVSGKKRNDLQAVIALLTEEKLDIPLQFKNFRD